jgi:uncharacterized protein (TIGR02757 family)
MAATLKTRLEALYSAYHHPAYMRLDPLEFVHRLSGRENREIGGLLCSSLAYGRVEQIRKSLEKILNITGNDIFQFGVEVPLEQKIRMLSPVKHRFNSGADIALLLQTAGSVIQEKGSLEELFCEGYKPSHSTIKLGLGTFVRSLRVVAKKAGIKPTAAFEFLFPNPGSGSTCKRLNMFLRWMVRKNDGIDFGIWSAVSASKLIIPVDTHVAAISRMLGLTKRKTVDWAMAEDITSALKKVSPDDPVRYDFSLCRAGMIDFRKTRNAE